MTQHRKRSTLHLQIGAISDQGIISYSFSTSYMVLSRPAMLTTVIWPRTTPDLLVASEQGLHEGLNPVPKHWAVPEALPLAARPRRFHLRTAKRQLSPSIRGLLDSPRSVALSSPWGESVALKILSREMILACTLKLKLCMKPLKSGHPALVVRLDAKRRVMCTGPVIVMSCFDR